MKRITKIIEYGLPAILSLLFLSLSLSVISQNPRNNYIKLRTLKNLQQLLGYKDNGFFLISAHRGGPENDLPENCIATFENTISNTPAILEIDPRYTRDSLIVLLHDPTLARTTTGQGRVIDYTLNELKEFRSKDLQGNPTDYKIPSLEETIKWAKGKAILLLDKKDVPLEKRLKMIEKNNAEAYTIIMAYTFDEAKLCYNLNKNIIMQVFINSVEKVKEFDKTGVPWNNVVAFVGHSKPTDLELMKMIHQRGTRCIMGTSRNLDLKYSRGEVSSIIDLKEEYNALLEMGIDIIETDIPVPLSKILPPVLNR
jgi:glycerophosphoryl diester phosphodiesterase